MILLEFLKIIKNMEIERRKVISKTNKNSIKINYTSEDSGILEIVYFEFSKDTTLIDIMIAIHELHNQKVTKIKNRIHDEYCDLKIIYRTLLFSFLDSPLNLFNFFDFLDFNVGYPNFILMIINIDYDKNLFLYIKISYNDDFSDEAMFPFLKRITFDELKELFELQKNKNTKKLSDYIKKIEYRKINLFK